MGLKRNRQKALMQRFKPLLFIAAVCLSVVIQNPQSLVRALERTGFMVIVVRGLKGHYDDFSDTLDGQENCR